jgi:ceramide glucosyltransferase
MTGPLSSSSALALLCLASAGAALHIVAVFRLRAHLLRKQGAANVATPPLTLWRAVKPGVPELDGKLDALVASSRPDDQILLGADAGSEELRSCEALRARHPARAIAVVACAPGMAPNPKISKFIQMTPQAIHEHWLMTDSEALPDAAFIEGFRREWAATGADALTAGYRFTGLRTAAAALDAAPILVTLWPGLMLAGRVRFTLGACAAVKASDVRALGGWEPLAADLAEDQQLGVRLASAGRRIGLSRHVLMLESDLRGWGAFLRHQHRAAVTYRAATRAGALGMAVLHTPIPALVAAAIHPAWWPWALVILAVRTACTAAFSRWLSFPIRWLPLAVVASAIVETAMWAAAWLSNRVWWSGCWRRVSWRGKLETPRHPRLEARATTTGLLEH